MNQLIQLISNEQNKTLTENGAVAHKSTFKSTLDLFSLGGSARNLPTNTIVSLFSSAFAEDSLTALKVLFYLRDVRGGQGERKVFRTCFKWLAENEPQIASKNLLNVVKYGRWDDLYCVRGTSVWQSEVLPMIKKEWFAGKPSLMFKWIASENTSSEETRKIAKEIRTYLQLSPKAYRKTLSTERAAIDVVEKKMCSNKWGEINYSGVPSRASLIYKNAFTKHDSDRYGKFIKSVKAGETTINAGTLYPYEIVERYFNADTSQTLDVLWDALPNYLENDYTKSIVVADVSGSMSGRPLAVSISLALYISERNKGVFKDCFITFSDHPKLVKVIGSNIEQKVRNLSQADWGTSTDLEATFDLILNTAKEHNVPASEMPDVVYIVSDMEFNEASSHSLTLFETIDEKYKASGYERPKLVFWNVKSGSHVPVTFDTDGTCIVSGCSPSILKSVVANKIQSPLQLMNDTINVDRYSTVVV